MKNFHPARHNLRSDIRNDLYRKAHELFYEYGFALPYATDFGYDPDNSHAVMHVRYGSKQLTYLLPKISDGVFSFEGAIESMALDERIPIAEPL